MIDLRDYPEIVKAWKMSEKLSDAHYPAGFKYENALGRTKCPFCDIYERDSNWQIVEFEDRHNNCNCSKAKKVRKHHSNLIKIDNERDKYNNEVFTRIIFVTFSKIQPKLILWRTGEIFLWKEVFGEEFEKLDNNDKSSLYCLVDRGWGSHIWADDVILLDGKSLKEKRDEILLLGQNPKHNLDGAYMVVRDDDVVIDNKNEIVYNCAKDGVIERHNVNRYNMTIQKIKEEEHRLIYNYKVFVTPQDQYKANSLIAIFAAFNGNKEKAKEYKDKAKKIENVVHDPKLDKLVDLI